MSKIIILNYTVIFCLLPFSPLSSHTDRFEMLYVCTGLLLTLFYIGGITAVNNMSLIMRFSLKFIVPVIWSLLLKFFVNKINIIYPVVSNTLFGFLFYLVVFLIILFTLIMNLIFISLVVNKKPFSFIKKPVLDGIPLPRDGNTSLYVIYFLFEIIFPVFLLYNIAFYNEHLFLLFCSMVITHFTFLFMAFKKITRTMRIVSVLVIGINLLIIISTINSGWLVSLMNFPSK